MSLFEKTPSKLAGFDMNGKLNPFWLPLHPSCLALHFAVATFPEQPEHDPVQDGFSNVGVHPAVKMRL